MAKKHDGSAQVCEVLTHLKEAKLADNGQGLAEVCVIQPGFNVGGGRYYPAEVLRRDHGIFEGVKMFRDHPTRAEEKARPEGSLNNWVGTLQGVRVDESGAIHGSPKIHDESFRALMSNLSEANCLSELGVSIRASGNVKDGKIDGRKTGVVESLDWACSVDFVTYPGAGGHAKLYESNQPNTGEPTMTPEELERLAALEESVNGTKKLMTTVVETMGQVSEAVAKLSEASDAKDESEGDDLKPDPDLAEAQKLLAEAQANLTESETKNKALEARGGILEAINESKLPDPAQARLVKDHGDCGDLESVKEAIKSETDYIASLGKGGNVHGLGDTGDTGDVKVSESDIQARIAKRTAHYISEGHTPEQAATMANDYVGR